MNEYPRSQEEYYDGMLRGFLKFAERQRSRVENLFDWNKKLDSYKHAKGILNQLYGIIVNIQMDGMFNESRKDMCIKVIKAVTELTKAKGDIFLETFLLN
jgi:hypothetical protein